MKPTRQKSTSRSRPLGELEDLRLMLRKKRSPKRGAATTSQHVRQIARGLDRILDPDRLLPLLGADTSSELDRMQRWISADVSPRAGPYRYTFPAPSVLR